MTTGRTTKSAINEVWRIFRDARILEDPRIIQGVAGLLGERLSPHSPTLLSLLPEPPQGLSQAERSRVIELLEEAARSGGSDLAQVFDRHVLFQLREMLPGNRYPTPRHLVAFLYRAAEVGPAMRLIDLACGTGGFLVHHQRTSGGAGACAGIEIDREWSGLAAVNLALHHQAFPGPPPQLYAMNALDSLPSELGGPFERVLFNPPFEENLQVAFLQRGLELLAEGGQLCALVSAGTLFSTGQTAVELRGQLLASDHRLRAVIELPPNVCQPFSAIRSFALLVEHVAPGGGAGQDAPVMFLRAETDGYSSVRARDLTLDPPNLGDLGLLEQLLRDQRAGSAPDDRPYRILEAEAGKQIVAARLLPREPGQPLVIELTQRDRADEQAAESNSSHQLPAPANQPGQTAGAAVTTYLHADDPPAQSIIVTLEGRLLGVGVAASSLKKPYDLQVSRFVNPRADTRRDDPTAVAEQLYQRERELLAAAAELRDMIDDRRERPAGFPPTFPSELMPQIRPVGQLSSDQRWVWQAAQRYRRDEGGTTTLDYFDLYDLLELLRDDPSPIRPAPTVVESTLALLEHMGLIVAVQLHVDNGERHLAYRLCSHYDLWEETPAPAEQQGA